MVVQLVPVMLVLFLVIVISLLPLFSLKSSGHCIEASTLSSVLVSPLPPSFLDAFSLSTSSLAYKALCIVISFLVLVSICLSSSLVHFKNGLENLTSGTAHVFVPFIRFLYIVWFTVALTFS